MNVSYFVLTRDGEPVVWKGTTRYANHARANTALAEIIAKIKADTSRLVTDMQTYAVVQVNENHTIYRSVRA